MLKIIGIGGFMIGFGFFILQFSTEFYFALISIIIISIGEILAFPIMPNYVVFIAPAQDQGKYLGIFTCVFSMPMLLTPLVGSFIYTKFSPSFLWNIIGMLGLFVFLGFNALHLIKPITK